MSAGILIVIFIFGVFFVFYKRHMLIKMFSMNIATMADEFRTVMESTADQAVKKLDHQMAQLEYLLEEADAKMVALESQLRQTEDKLTAASSALMNQAVEKSLTDSPQGLSAIPVIQETPSLQKQADLRVHFPPQPQPQFPTKLYDITQDKRQQVILLHHQGYNVMEIAKATSMGKGEVMLLLELNKS